MNFKDNFLTTPTHPHYTVTVNAYNKYTDTSVAFFHQNTAISQESAPCAYHLVQEQQILSDGFVILFHIIQRGCPHLGGIGIDLYSYMDQLTLSNGGSLTSFLSECSLHDHRNSISR